MTIVVSLTRKEQIRRLVISCVVYSILFLAGSLPLYDHHLWLRVFITAFTTGLCFGIASTITGYFDRAGWDKASSLPEWKNVFKELMFGPGPESGQQIMSKNPPDWWARTFGIVGILIGLSGLFATYFNNRWQREVYQKGLEERIFVELSASYKLSSLLSSQKSEEQSAEGQLAVEIINLSMQPIYLKSITGDIAGHRASFYEHDPLSAKEPMRRLEPGEATDYKVEWASLVKDIEKAPASGIVQVETTKKRFSQNARVSRITVSSDMVELLAIRPGKLQRPH